MPFDVIDNADALQSLIVFRGSAPYELLLSIRHLFLPARYGQEFAERAHVQIPPAVWDELQILFTRFNDGGYYFELPIGYGGTDVEGFIRYVRAIDSREFLFYALGRLFTREQIGMHLLARRPVESFKAVLESMPTKFHWYQSALESLVGDTAQLKIRLADALEHYWHFFFRAELPMLETVWKGAIAERRAILTDAGGRALLENITGYATLPPELPPGTPYHEVVMSPCVFLPARVFQFYGYGSVTMLFNPAINDQTHAIAEQARRAAILTLKALDDDTRLKILQMVVQHGHRMHGKQIAERLHISASAVSRHLALLKEGGLITEQPQKNLITYRFNREALTQLSDHLLDYLYS